MSCLYCDKRAIGYERMPIGGTVEFIHVCSGCAHIGRLVHLYNGETLRKRPLVAGRPALTFTVIED